MTIEVYADELLRLTVGDLGDEILVTIKDPENETDEHLAHLRKLVDQRAEKDWSKAVDAGELEERLGQVSPRRSKPSSRSSSFSATPVIDEEEEKRERWRIEQEAYQALVADGGRPSHPIGDDMLHRPAEYEEIISFWRYINPQGTIFHAQQWTWNEFREFQERMRKFYIPRDRFHEYENIVQESGKDLGYKWDLKVHRDRHEQSRLEDWNEFRALHYRRFKKSKVTWNKKIAEAKLRVELAEKSVQAAEESDQSMNSQGRAALFEKAQKEVRSAKANLAHASGHEETRRLRDACEIHNLREEKRQAESYLASVQLPGKKWEYFLNWIDDQYPAVAAECGHTIEASVKDPDQGLKEQRSSTSQKLCSAPRQRRHPHRQTVVGPSSSRVSKRSKRKSVSRAQELPTPSVIPPPTLTQSDPTVNQCFAMTAKQSTSANSVGSHDNHGDRAKADLSASTLVRRNRQARSALKSVQSGVSKKQRSRRSIQKSKPRRVGHPQKVFVNTTKGRKQNVAYHAKTLMTKGLQDDKQWHSNLTQIVAKTRSGRESKLPERFCPG